MTSLEVRTRVSQSLPSQPPPALDVTLCLNFPLLSSTPRQRQGVVTQLRERIRVSRSLFSLLSWIHGWLQLTFDSTSTLCWSVVGSSTRAQWSLPDPYPCPDSFRTAGSRVRSFTLPDPYSYQYHFFGCLELYINPHVPSISDD